MPNLRQNQPPGSHSKFLKIKNTGMTDNRLLLKFTDYDFRVLRHSVLFLSSFSFVFGVTIPYKKFCRSISKHVGSLTVHSNSHFCCSCQQLNQNAELTYFSDYSIISFLFSEPDKFHLELFDMSKPRHRTNLLTKRLVSQGAVSIIMRNQSRITNKESTVSVIVKQDMRTIVGDPDNSHINYDEAKVSPDITVSIPASGHAYGYSVCI